MARHVQKEAGDQGAHVAFIGVSHGAIHVLIGGVHRIGGGVALEGQAQVVGLRDAAVGRPIGRRTLRRRFVLSLRPAQRPQLWFIATE